MNIIIIGIVSEASALKESAAKRVALGPSALPRLHYKFGGREISGPALEGRDPGSAC